MPFFPKDELLRILLDGFDDLVEVLQRLAPIDREPLILAQSGAGEMVEIGGQLFRALIEMIGEDMN